MPCTFPLPASLLPDNQRDSVGLLDVYTWLISVNLNSKIHKFFRKAHPLIDEVLLIQYEIQSSIDKRVF